MDTTPNLGLPYLAAAQSQKHVTHNEAIRSLDALVQLAVASRLVAIPPASPAEGIRYIVAAAATGAWLGQSLKIAAFQDGAWAFFTPRAGWLVYVADEAKLVVFDGTQWTAVAGNGGIASTNPVPFVGVNATADATNRLTVKSPATLFDNIGNGHQLKINKAAASDTASLLLQDAYSGRAEIGLAGDDSLHIKVSANGSVWKEALLIDSASGSVSFPSGATLAGGSTAPFWAAGLDATAKCTLTNTMFLAAEGDSLTVGQSAIPGVWELTAGFSYSDLYKASDSSGKLGYVNVAAGGSGLANVQARAAALDVLLANNPGYASYCLSVFIGVNDGVYPANPNLQYPNGTGPGPAGTDWQSQFKAYLTARRTAGWQRIVVCTITPYNTEKTAADSAGRKLTNTFIRSLVASGHANAIIDFASDPIMGNPASMNPIADAGGPASLYFHDYVHQSAFGHMRQQLIAAPVYNAQAVSALAAAAAPAAVPAGGTYGSQQTVSLTTSTAGAAIYYTTNGTTPTTASTLYVTPLPIAATTTLNAIAVKSGIGNSPVTMATYTISTTVATPTLAPAAGTYSGTQSIVITSATAGATIYYTTDGLTPTTASAVYSSAIALNASATVKTFAIKAGMLNSGIASAAYVISQPAALPTFSPAAGTFATPQSITLASATPGATIYVTTDGTTPTTASTVVTGPIAVPSSLTLKAIATANGFTSSAVATATYTIANASQTTWNAADAGANYTLDASKRTLSAPTGNLVYVRAGLVPITTKTIVEILFTGAAGAPNSYASFGLANTAAALGSNINASGALVGGVFQNAVGQVIATGTGFTVVNATGVWPRPLVDGQRGLLAIDPIAGKLWWSFNGGVFNQYRDPATGLGPDATFTPGGTYWLTAQQYNYLGSPAFTLQASVVGAIPAGYTALNG
jgi:Protein of unknown function (DUF2793)/Chitobiase/beta-hexosaminidase C-terminal domain